MNLREMDKLIAEKLFELEVTDNCFAAPYVVDYGIGEGGWEGPLLKYSSNMSAAYQIIKHFLKKGEIFNLEGHPKEGFYVSILHPNSTKDCSGHALAVDSCPGCEFTGYAWSKADTAPLAITLAALKALEIEVSE